LSVFVKAKIAHLVFPRCGWLSAHFTALWLAGWLQITNVLEDRQRSKVEKYSNGDLQIMLGCISMKDTPPTRVRLDHVCAVL
jgi:hypothetical protein